MLHLVQNGEPIFGSEFNGLNAAMLAARELTKEEGVDTEVRRTSTGDLVCAFRISTRGVELVLHDEETGGTFQRVVCV